MKPVGTPMEGPGPTGPSPSCTDLHVLLTLLCFYSNLDPLFTGFLETPVNSTYLPKMTGQAGDLIL